MYTVSAPLVLSHVFIVIKPHAVYEQHPGKHITRLGPGSESTLMH